MEVGTLYLEVCAGQTLFGADTYTIMFNVVNPYATQTSPDVFIGLGRSEEKGPLIAPSVVQAPSKVSTDANGCEILSESVLFTLKPQPSTQDLKP